MSSDTISRIEAYQEVPVANIVIADDSTVVRKKLNMILTQNRHTVLTEATNGVEAIEAYNKLKPDLLTLDIEMPVLNGIDVLKSILSNNPDARIIMVTGADNKERIMEAIKAGAKNYIIKPFEINKMLQVIARVLGESGPECEYLNICTVYKKIKSGTIDRFYAQKYCSGDDYKECIIRKKRIAGDEVPVTILPDGTSI